MYYQGPFGCSCKEIDVANELILTWMKHSMCIYIVCSSVLLPRIILFCMFWLTISCYVVLWRQISMRQLYGHKAIGILYPDGCCVYVMEREMCHQKSPKVSVRCKRVLYLLLWKYYCKRQIILMLDMLIVLQRIRQVHRIALFNTSMQAFQKAILWRWKSKRRGKVLWLQISTCWCRACPG